MKIFAVVAKVQITQQPHWLEGFFQKHGTTFGYHVTLKQVCYLEERNIQDVKHRLEAFFRSLSVSDHKIELSFDDLVVDKDADGLETMMIDAKENRIINELQSGILSCLKPYDDFVNTGTEKYEKNFKPHITIASNLDPAQYESVRAELGRDYFCKGVINEIYLIIADKPGAEEGAKPENQTVYRL
ncbi:MAG: 2'-5' RNA ligase family protein [Patescibacteria group bacterium]